MLIEHQSLLNQNGKFLQRQSLLLNYPYIAHYNHDEQFITFKISFFIFKLVYFYFPII